MPEASLNASLAYLYRYMGKFKSIWTHRTRTQKCAFLYVYTLTFMGFQKYLGVDEEEVLYKNSSATCC